MSDDLTTAYLLGAEQMRDKLHKQADEIERLRERLAEADECNRRVSDENQRIRQAIKEYLGNLARVTNDMLRETWERESGDE